MNALLGINTTAQTSFDKQTGKEFAAGTQVNTGTGLNLQSLLVAGGVPTAQQGLSLGQLGAGNSPRQNVKAAGETVVNTQRAKPAIQSTLLGGGGGRKKNPFLALPTTPNPSLFGLNIL